MQVKLLSAHNSLLHQYVSELRDVSIQHDRMRFRRNVERIGQVMAYELSKTLPWKAREITTPLGKYEATVLAEQPVLAAILRAGLSMHQGLLDFFDHADCAFISAYRHHTSEHDFDIVVDYLACPDLNDRILVLVDPMLATGQSIELTYKALLERGTPKEVHVISLIASRQGVEYLQGKIPTATLWLADMDEHLNEYGYIVPGLGDAGDLSFGVKLDT